MAAATQTRRILIKVDTTDAKGLNDVANRLGLLNKNAKSLAGNMNYLTNAFKGWLGYIGIREIVSLSDTMQNLENRLKIVTTDGRAAADVLNDIRDIAARTYQPISDVAEVYARMGTSLRNVKADTNQLGALTETLINTFRVAGTTATETTNTMIQLSQSFSSGEVRGQELRSVLEQNATLAGYLRKEFGKDIFKAAENGMIKASTITKVLIENFEEIMNQSKLLTPTFEQGVSKATTDFALAVHGLNKEFEISLKFFKLMTGIVENFGTILAAVAAGALTYFIGTMFTMETSILAAYYAMRLFLLTNPVGWALLAGAAVFSLITDVGGLSNALDLLEITWYRMKSAILSVGTAFYSVFGSDDLVAKFNDEILITEAKINGLYEDITRREMEAAAGKKDNTAATLDYLKSLKKQQELFEGAGTKTKKIKEILGDLNKELQSGKISLGEYNEKLIKFELYKLNREFGEGKMDVFAYNKRLKELNLDDLNRQLAQGNINLEKFQSLADGNTLKALDAQFEAGKISLQEYNVELLKLQDKFRPGAAFSVGVQSYIDSIGTLSQGVAKVIEQSFGHLEDSLTEFVKTGKFNFADFTNAVLDDLLKIIIRAQVIAPLAKGLLSFGAPDAAGGTTSYSADYLASAKGNAFDGGKLMAFAKGGVVNSPTAFSYGGGKRGLMGEAGSEAIMPLKRGSNGQLGVQATSAPVIVTINNNAAGTEATQTETRGANGERFLEITVQNIVAKGFSSGAFDKSLNSQYNLRRKGS